MTSPAAEEPPHQEREHEYTRNEKRTRRNSPLRQRGRETIEVHATNRGIALNVVSVDVTENGSVDDGQHNQAECR